MKKRILKFIFILSLGVFAIPSFSLASEVYLVSGSADFTVRKIDPFGDEVWRFEGHDSPVRSVAVDNNDYVYSGSNDGTVRKIDPSGDEVWKFEGHTDSVDGVAVDNDGYIYSGSKDETVRKIDPSGNEVWKFEGHTGWVNAVAVDNDGYIYSGSADDTVRKIDPSGSQVWRFDGHTASLMAVVVDNDGYVYSSGGVDETVRKIDPSGNEVWKFDGHTDWVNAVAVDNDGYVYSGSTDETVRKIDPSGNEVWKFEGHTGGLIAVAVDNDGYVYSGGHDNTVIKIDPSGNEVWRFNGHTNTVRSLAVFSEEEEGYEIPDDTTIDFEALGSYGDDAGVGMSHNYFYEDVENERIGFNYSLHRIRAADEEGDFYIPWIDDTLEFTERMLVFEDPSGEDLIEYFQFGSRVYQWDRRYPLTNYFRVGNQNFYVDVSFFESKLESGHTYYYQMQFERPHREDSEKTLYSYSPIRPFSWYEDEDGKMDDALMQDQFDEGMEHKTQFELEQKHLEQVGFWVRSIQNFSDRMKKVFPISWIMEIEELFKDYEEEGEEKYPSMYISIPYGEEEGSEFNMFPVEDIMEDDDFRDSGIYFGGYIDTFRFILSASIYALLMLYIYKRGKTLISRLATFEN